MQPEIRIAATINMETRSDHDFISLLHIIPLFSYTKYNCIVEPIALFFKVIVVDKYIIGANAFRICNVPYADIIISFMEFGLQHDWVVDSGTGRKLQDHLSKNIIHYNDILSPRAIAGVDVSVTRFSKTGRAAVVVLDWPSMEIIDFSIAEGKINFPYIPGLLSFREAPLVIEAWKGLKIQPDITIFDGQGIAHPRRLGIASHLGLLLDIVSIGCAKSRLIGEHAEVPEQRNNYSLLKDGDEVIGAVVRTRQAVKPVYVSLGHKIDLAQSIAWVLKCCRGLRLPEPTRLAHQAAGGHLNKCSAGREIKI